MKLLTINEDFETELELQNTDKNTRLSILKKSLEKKQELFNTKLQAHFDDVRSANGQPLNDKRNGPATMARWERQNDSLHALNLEIIKTKNAIEREEGKAIEVEKMKDKLPMEILALLDMGELIQWKKFPNFFFVPGVETGRMLWDIKTQQLFNRYYKDIPTQEQKDKFRNVYNELYKLIKSRLEMEKTLAAENPEIEPIQEPIKQAIKNTSKHLKTAPANYEDGGWTVSVRNRDEYKVEVEKLSKLKPGATATVELNKKWQWARVVWDGDKYIVYKLMESGEIDSARTSEYTKEYFERNSIRLI